MNSVCKQRLIVKKEGTRNHVCKRILTCWTAALSEKTVFTTIGHYKLPKTVCIVMKLYRV